MLLVADFIMRRFLDVMLVVTWENALLAPCIHLSVLEANAWASWLEITFELGSAFGRPGDPRDEFQ